MRRQRRREGREGDDILKKMGMLLLESVARTVSVECIHCLMHEANFEELGQSHQSLRLGKVNKGKPAFRLNDSSACGQLKPRHPATSASCFIGRKFTSEKRNIPRQCCARHSLHLISPHAKAGHYLYKHFSVFGYRYRCKL